MGYLHKDMFGTDAHERDRFSKTAEDHLKAGKPLRLQLGFGRHPLRDFLNLDFRYRVLEEREPAEHFESTFIFNWPQGIPLPDNSVDFVFHEDMFEHLNQREQYQLLAEVWRVLIPGRFHRINCPNIEYIMRTESDFTRGRDGVYDEWAAWHHVNVPTKASLEEQARIVGYSKVHFNGKNQTVSGVKFRERRPGGQYDQTQYNIFADLEK
jgi:SAM-dependent methyltransferase